MSVRNTPWEPGTPCWYDLAAGDLTAAKEFYSSLLGWQYLETGEEYGNYAFALVRDMPVAGLGPTMDGLPVAPFWTVYLAVEDADKSTEAVAEHGGTVIVPPMAIGDQGRMVVAVDPTGALFGLWESNRMFGAVLVNEPGGVVWNSHHSPDPQAAKDFYGAVLGYRYTESEGHSSIDGAGPGGTIGSIAGPDDDLPADVPAHWQTFFVVENADEVCARAVAGGATVVEAPEDTPWGPMAALRDPQGTYFKIAAIPAM